MLCIDLCAGLGGFSQAFKDDFEVITIDIDKKFKPTICADVCNLPLKEDLAPEVLLMSPPCQRFSLACLQWPKKGIMKALEMVGACLEAVVYLKPKKWLMENPKGRLRWFIGIPKQTIRYSDYDLKYHAEKLTDLWGNINLPMVIAQRRIKRKKQRDHLKRDHRWEDVYPHNPALRAFIPMGVSQAVKQGVLHNTRIKGEENAEQI